MALFYRISWICILFGSSTLAGVPPKKIDWFQALGHRGFQPPDAASLTGCPGTIQVEGGQVQQTPAKCQLPKPPKTPKPPKIPKPVNYYASFMNLVNSNAPGLFTRKPQTKPSKPGKGSSHQIPQSYLPVYVKKSQHKYQRGKMAYSKTRYTKGSSSP